MKRKSEPTAVASVLSSLLKKKDISKAKTLDFLDSWDQVVGSQLSKISKPSELKKGILTVKVIDVAWVQEISFEEPKIIEKLCDMGYGGVVNKIKFIVGSPVDFR